MRVSEAHDPPRFLLAQASYELDEIPVLPYDSLFELANALAPRP